MKSKDDLLTTEWIRWGLLRIVSASGIHGLSDSHLLAAMQQEFALTEKEMINELAYLEQKGLVKINVHHIKRGRTFLTAHGRDFVEGNTDSITGIYRPPSEG